LRSRCRQDPLGSLEEPVASDLWTKVVKKEKNRLKTKKYKMSETNQLLGGFWNIRGLNKSGRRKCLTDFISQNKLNFVGIQEKKIFHSEWFSRNC
jgi:hypothetical protein